MPIFKDIYVTEHENWTVEQEWRATLHTHPALTTTEALDMLNRKYGKSISVFDQIEKQALEMADVMRNGIIRQFPDKFN